MPSNRPHTATEFHHAYLAALRSQTEPAQVLAGVLIKKLRETVRPCGCSCVMCGEARRGDALHQVNRKIAVIAAN